VVELGKGNVVVTNSVVVLGIGKVVDFVDVLGLGVDVEVLGLTVD